MEIKVVDGNPVVNLETERERHFMLRAAKAVGNQAVSATLKDSSDVSVNETLVKPVDAMDLLNAVRHNSSLRNLMFGVSKSRAKTYENQVIDSYMKKSF